MCWRTWSRCRRRSAPASTSAPSSTVFRAWSGATSSPGTWTFGRDQFFDPLNPSFSFNSLTAPTQFTASFPNVYRDIVSHTYAAYVSDEWKPFGGVTFNLGLRYDIHTGVWDEHHTQAEYPRPL